jgi:hypothetical protein
MGLLCIEFIVTTKAALRKSFVPSFPLKCEVPVMIIGYYRVRVVVYSDLHLHAMHKSFDFFTELNVNYKFPFVEFGNFLLSF